MWISEWAASFLIAIGKVDEKIRDIFSGSQLLVINCHHVKGCLKDKD